MNKQELKDYLNSFDTAEKRAELEETITDVLAEVRYDEKELYRYGEILAAFANAYNYAIHYATELEFQRRSYEDGQQGRTDTHELPGDELYGGGF